MGNRNLLFFRWQVGFAKKFKGCGQGDEKVRYFQRRNFLETKIWPAFYEQEDAVEKTLERLDTDYIDLLLIHQPAGNYQAWYPLGHGGGRLA